jgi:2-dehydropantoate 2-reductase
MGTIILMRYAIFGMGAIGSFLAALFNRAEKDILICEGDYPYANLKKEGITIHSELFGGLIVPPKKIKFLNDSFDILIVSLKATDLYSALKSLELEKKKNIIILSLQNGLGIREEIRKVTNHPIVIGTIANIEIFKTNHSEYIHSTSLIPKISIASSDVSLKNLSMISSELQKLNIECEVFSDEKSVIWGKLIRLSSVGTMNAFFNMNLEEIRADNKSAKILNKIVEEFIEVAAKERCSIDSNKVLRSISMLSGELITSMARDLKIGKKSEIEYILGNPLRVGISHGLNLPVMKKCYEKLSSA